MRATRPGVLAVTTSGDLTMASSVRSCLASLGHDPVVHTGPGLVVATWGADLRPDGTLLLSRGPRRHEHDLEVDEVSRLIAADLPTPLSGILPPFAAFRRTAPSEAVATTDALGFLHLYRTQWSGAAAVSTSARALALLTGADLDFEAVTLQSLLGWQVGPWTLFEGVTKLGPGERVHLAGGRIAVEDARPGTPPAMELEDAVPAASRMLREYLTAYVTDHPDAMLQLTGGQDSRILLSAIPPELRRGLRALTLSVPGSQDVAIAARLAARTGLTHQVEALESLQGMEPQEAHSRCVDASRRLEGMADPIALAALSIAEQRFEQGHRIAGLGGEVARGFYYVGNPRDATVTRERVARLAAWRMFANESIDPAALAQGLREGARERAVQRIHGLMAATGREWLAATDDFYLDQRMQRWAGVTDTAVSFDRSVVNPMLDDRFISIARGMPPAAKRGSMFLARLQMALDPELGRMPLDGRPAPEAYAQRSLVNRARTVETLAKKAAAKARQRLGHSTRPPAGGEVLAAKVVDHWRRAPDLLDRARETKVLDHAWLDEMLAGRLDPAPSTVAFVINLAALPSSRQGAVQL
jgi:asparagine synthase (glutamine-hydrolysing)